MDGTAIEAILSHVGPGDREPHGFLPSLRRGQPVSPAGVSELMAALHQIEADQHGASMLDRRLAYALHRLALESQVLLTEAWPGVFDDRTIGAIRAVQEAVERILSGQDIRYYQARTPGRGESVVNETAPPSWPDPPTAGPLGDGRSALARLRPETVDALCEAVRDTGRGPRDLSAGGGTAIDYGGIPGRPGVAIDTRSIDRVIDYPHADMTITVQAGMTAAALQAVLAEQHQRLLVDIPRRTGRRWAGSMRPTRAARGGSAWAGLATRSSGSAS